MRIVFYDRTPVDYTPETPFQRALGGSESALCYLAIALARLGHAVHLVTNTSAPDTYRGVGCSNHHDKDTFARLNAADVVVAGNEALGRWLRDKGAVARPMVLWIQHAHDQPAIRGLEVARERKSWQGYAFVSEWQRDRFEEEFWVPRQRARVMRNAISPAFEHIIAARRWYRTGEPPVLVYTSQPYRGLDVLLDAFPVIRDAVPGTRLRVFSGFAATYGTAIASDPFAALYRRCREIDGVEYIGPIGQPALAGELAQAAALAYPSTFAETSCIAVMEAMAAGAAVLTTRLGALPETAAGFAHMIDSHSDKKRLAREFAAMTVETLRAMLRDPDAADSRMAAQRAHIQEHGTWDARAREWQMWLSEIVRAAATPA